MRIVLIGNYLPDRQQSMQRFATLLQDGFTEAGIESVIWNPPTVFAKGFANTTSGIGKWLGYIDKWVIFPLILWWRVRLSAFKGPSFRFHVCDHSNAPYLHYLPANRTVITCHDVLAIRGAIGYTDAYCPATKTGKILQKWILKHLVKAKKIAADTQCTLNQLQEIAPQTAKPGKDWRVIYISFNARFTPVTVAQSYLTLSKFGLTETDPFILHVGSNLQRKNRAMLLDMVANLGTKWNGKICFAGQPLNDVLRTKAKALGIEDRVIEVPNPDHTTLLALYSTCYALVFPSFSEGFGWPIIEAQACGAPVITSNLEPMPEVSGGAALTADPTQPHEFANALLSINDKKLRDKLIQDGFVNCKRFQQPDMINAYLDLHRSS